MLVIRRNHLAAVLAGLATGGLYVLGALRSPVAALGLLAGLLGCLLVVSYPWIGMAMLTFLIPLERLQRFTSDTASFTISVMRIVALMCLASLVIHRVLEKRSLRLDPSMFLYGGFVGVSILGLLHTTDPETGKRALGTILANCLFFLLYFNFLERRAQIRLVIVIWLVASLTGAAYSTYDWHLGSGRSGGIVSESDPGEGLQTAENRWSTVWQDRAEWETLSGLSVRRSMGPTSHAAVYGINLIMTIPFFFYLLHRHRRLWQQIALYLGLALIGYNILLTNTRAVILLALGTGPLCLLYGLYKPRKSHLLALLVGALVMVPLLPKDIYNRVLDPHNYSSERSAAMRVRFAYWDAGLRILLDHPLLGVGVGNSKAVPQYTKEVGAEKTTVHNIFLQIAMESGVIGWLLFFSFVGLAFYSARHAALWFRHQAEWQEEYLILTAIQVVMITVLIFGLQADVFMFPLKGWWLMATIAFVLHGWAHASQQQAMAGVSEPAPLRPCQASG